MSLGQILRLLEGTVVIFCGMGLSVCPAKLRRESLAAKVLLWLLVAAAMGAEAAGTFFAKYSGSLYNALWLFLLLVLYAFFQTDFLPLLTRSLVYWVNVKIAHYAVIILSCKWNEEIFNSYVEEARELPYTALHMAGMAVIGGTVVWLWYRTRGRAFLAWVDGRGSWFLLALVLGELLVDGLVFRGRANMVFVSDEYLMLLGALFFLMAAVFLIFRNSQKNLLLRHQEQLMKMNYERMAGQYAQIEELYAAQRRQIHDIRQQQILLADYLERGQVEEAKAYLKETSASLCRKTQNRYSGIATVDFILNYKENAGRERGISFQIEANVLFCPLKESEMCILLGNLLDNAMEAVEDLEPEKRGVSVHMRTENRMFFLEIKNAYLGPRRKAEGRYLTTKENDKMHGFGLESVRQIVDGNGGMLEIQDDGSVFEVSVILMGNADFGTELAPVEGQKSGEEGQNGFQGKNSDKMIP